MPRRTQNFAGYRRNSEMLDPQTILADAFVALGPETFSTRGRLISARHHLAGKVLSSACQRLKSGWSHDAGSVDRLTAALEVDRLITETK